MDRLRRSLHFVPGGNEKMFGRALTLPADALILDLEDSVTPGRKLQARRRVCRWLEQADFGPREKLVRINPLDSDFGRADLEAVIPCRPDGLVVPKVEDARILVALDSTLQELEKGQGLAAGTIRLHLIATETAAAVFNLREMAAQERVAGLSWGAEDLTCSLGARSQRDGEGNYLDVFRVVRSLTLLAAVAGGAQPIDGVYVNVKDSRGFRADCESGAAMGFTGKLTIHPDQIEVVNRVFTPGDEEIDAARALVDAFAEKPDRGAFLHEGRMVDIPHLKRAQRVLAMAELIKSR